MNTFVQDLVAETKRIITDPVVVETANLSKDPAYTPHDILQVLNQGVLEVAGRPMLANNSKLPALPDLWTAQPLPTTPGDGAVSMPEAFQQGPVLVLNAAKREIPVLEYFGDFLSAFPVRTSAAGSDIDRASLAGRTLHYSPIPAASVELTVYFYRFPVPMGIESGAAQTAPDGIPLHLCKPILVNFAAKEVFYAMDRAGSGGDSPVLRKLAEKHEARYQMALIDLSRFLGPMPLKAWNVE
jgi:hypothetical protein